MAHPRDESSCPEVLFITPKRRVQVGIASCLNSGEKERRFLVIRHLVYGDDLTTYVGVRNH